ncbi:hypothetical protein Tco_0534654 [Tanacetum coccineum]
MRDDMVVEGNEELRTAEPKRLQDCKLLQGQDATNAERPRRMEHSDEEQSFVSCREQTISWQASHLKTPILHEPGPHTTRSNPLKSVQEHDALVDHMDEYHDVYEVKTMYNTTTLLTSDADYSE